MAKRAPRHPSIPKVHGFGDGIMLSAHDATQPWYIDRERSTKQRVVFNPDFRAPRGVIRVPDRPARWARERVYGHEILIEPHIKGKFSSTNKRWPWAYWRRLVELAHQHELELVQCARPGLALLEGVRAVPSPSFWHAVALIDRLRGVVTTEGGLHHAAAALNKPAVVIWGCYSDPKILGYPDHVNLYEPDPEGLGQRRPHPACEAAMRRITPERVLEGMTTLWC